MLRRSKIRALTPLLVLLACLTAGPAHAICSSPSGNEADRIYNQAYHTWQYCNGLHWVPFGGVVASGGGGGGCSSPAGKEADQIYNSAYHTWQFCNGTAWISYTLGALTGGGSGCSSPTGHEADQLYNENYHSWQFCNGNSWVAFGVATGQIYIGPGDIASGAKAWYGLRAYNNAYMGSKAINIRRASDNSTEDINVLSPAGGLDTATASSFAGTDATATCSTSGSSTTLSCTGASSTPNASDQIYGTGITNPTFITSCGTFTSGAGTCTMNVARTVSSETVTFQVALFVPTWYDQSGNGKNETQSTATQQPQLLFDCSGTLPCIYFNATSGTAYSLSATISSISQPYCMSLVASPLGQGRNPNLWMGNNTVFYASNQYNANEIGIYSGNLVGSTPITLGNYYAFQSLFNGSSSKVGLNGAIVTSLNAGTNATSTTMYIGSNGSHGGGLYFLEGGLWSSDISSLWSSLNSNQRTYWGF